MSAFLYLEFCFICLQVLCGTVIHSKTSFALLQLSQKGGSAISCDEVRAMPRSPGFTPTAHRCSMPLSSFLKATLKANLEPVFLFRLTSSKLDPPLPTRSTHYHARARKCRQ